MDSETCDENRQMAPTPEASRLEALHRYALLESAPEDSFDDLVKMAARYFDVPYSVISLVDSDRIWFKARFGIDDPQVARIPGLCATAIQQTSIYHLFDASLDDVAMKHPLVMPDDGIRFYAGHPLTTADGFNIGSVCVMGHSPRELSDDDREFLIALSRLVTNEIERRYAQEELQRLNRDLDFRIHERTKALDSAIHELESEVEARIQAHEAVVQGHKRQRRIAELSGDYCYELDFSNWTKPVLIWSSGPAEDMTGFKMSELDIAQWEKYVHPDDRALFPPLFETAITTGEAAAEYRFLRKDGQYRRVRIHVGLSPKDSDTKGPCVIAAVKDLDKLRRAEDLVAERTRDLKQSRVQLREARRLAWLGTVAAGMAHQINNPVGSMLAAAQFALLCEGQPDERTTWKEALRNVEAEAKRCGEIVRGIRRFARGESISKKRENLCEIVVTALQLVESYANERHVVIETDFQLDSIEARVGKVDIEETLVNIVRNAIESQPAHPVRIRVSATSDSAMIEIEDDGCGIPADQCREVFDPFFTTRLTEGGTGLGLSIADGVIADHKGTIELSSQLGKGTRVLIRLPIDSI